MKVNRNILQQLLNARGINIGDLRNKGVSSVVLAKIAKGDDVRVATVLQIAAALKVDADILVETDSFPFFTDDFETATKQIDHR